MVAHLSLCLLRVRCRLPAADCLSASWAFCCSRGLSLSGDSSRCGTSCQSLGLHLLVSVSLSTSVSVPLSLYSSTSLYLSVSAPLRLCASLPLCISLTLYPSVSISVCLYISLSPSLCRCISLPVSLCPPPSPLLAPPPVSEETAADKPQLPLATFTP